MLCQEKITSCSVTIIIDAFRAFSTACTVLAQNPESYFLTDSCSEVLRLKGLASDAILIGKPEISSTVSYIIPNSPTRARELNLRDRTVIHRTAAGGLGVRLHRDADILLAACFMNAKATADVIHELKPTSIKIIPMGHEGKSAALEDDLCARYIEALVKRESFAIEPYREALREGSGKYFFGEDQYQYPSSDFDYCLEFNTFPFAIIVENRGDFAILKKRGAVSEDELRS